MTPTTLPTPSLDQLADLIIEWGKSKGILDHATPQSQYLKTVEEVQELGEGLMNEDDDEILDAVGDTVVTLVLLAKIKGWTLRDCVQHAYDVIKHRTGRMSGGIFIKDVPTDDDLGELDASKACSIDNPECESCS